MKCLNLVTTRLFVFTTRNHSYLISLSHCYCLYSHILPVLNCPIYLYVPATHFFLLFLLPVHSLGSLTSFSAVPRYQYELFDVLWCPLKNRSGFLLLYEYPQSGSDNEVVPNFLFLSKFLQFKYWTQIIIYVSRGKPLVNSKITYY